MTAKEELRQIRDIDMEVKDLEDSLLELETKLTRITPILSDMPKGGGDNDKMSAGISKLVEMKKEYWQRISQLRDYQKKCETIVFGLSCSIYRFILYQRYFKYRSFNEISEMSNYSYRHICRLHGEALKEYETIKRWQDMSYSDMK